MRTRNTVLRACAFLTTIAAGALAAQAQEDKRANVDDPPITVYKPYSKMDEIWSEKGGVYLPAHELERLLEKIKALSNQPLAEKDTPPPEPYVHVGSRYKASADETVARFEATLDFEVLEKKKWVEIPLGFGSKVSLEECRTGDGKRAIVRSGKDGGFSVLIQGGGPLTLTAKFTVPINKDKPGQRSFDLFVPRSALSTFEVDLPERGLKVDVAPSLGTSLHDAADTTTGAANGKTHVTAYLGAGSTNVTVTWFPRPKESLEGPQKSLVFSELATGLRLDEGVAKAIVLARYTVEQSPTDTFRISVPSDWKILEVQADGMRDHETTEANGRQVLRVGFHERVKQALVSFRLERARDDGAKFEFPVIKTLDVERETGLLAAASSSFLKLEAAKITGLSQVDPSEIPARLAAEVRNEAMGDRPPLGFRFLKNDYKLELATTKVEPEVEGKVYALATVRDEEIGYFATIVYDIKKRGIFSVRIKLPVGFTLLDCGDESTVKSSNVRDAVAADKWPGQILDVDFPRQARPGTYTLKLSGTLAKKDLAKLALPVIALDGVTKETGLLAFGAQKHLKLTSASQPTGLVPVPVAELPGLGFPYGTQENEELVFGFKYGKPGAAATIDVTKREPKVTATVETVANADLDRINVDCDIRYKVEFAGVDKLQLQVPAVLNTDILFKITSPDGVAIKSAKCSEPSADKKTVTWDVELQAKREGTFRLHYHYEVKLPVMTAGEQREVGLHEVVALGAERETGDLVLLKHENLVISDAAVEGLETRHATRELPENLAKLNGFHGYHYVAHPWKLELRIIKYDFQAPLGKIIEHLHLDEVLLRDGVLQCEAWIKLRNNQAQFLRVLLPRGAETRAVRVGDKNVAPSKFASEDHTGVDVMLPEETRRGETVIVRIRYWKKDPTPFGVMGSVDLEAPTFPTDDRTDSGKVATVPVARFTRYVYLPDNVCYTDFDTDMTPHFERGGIFESAKKLIFAHLHEGSEGAAAAYAAAEQIHTMGTDDRSGAYPPLEKPTQGTGAQGHRLFEKLDGQAKLRVVYASWPTLYGLGVLALVLVVAAGAFLEGRKLVSPVAYFAVSAGTCFLLAVIASRSVEPFLTTALIGSGGLGAYWILRAVWREVTVEQHKRHLEALGREAEVAKARASAAEAEARAAGMGARPAPAQPKDTPLSPSEARAAGEIASDLPPAGGAAS